MTVNRRGTGLAQPASLVAQEWQSGPTPVLGGLVSELVESDGSWTLVRDTESHVWGEGGSGPAALLDYAISRQELREMEAADALHNKAEWRG